MSTTTQPTTNQKTRQSMTHDPQAAQQTMQAIVYDDYGDPEVLRLTDRPRPRRKSDQLLIEVHASSVNPIDYRLRRGEMKGLLPGGFPRIPGYDVAGVVRECSADSSWAPGDRVLAFLDHWRGGALAEYATCSTQAAAKLPNEIPFDEAAALPLAGTTALQSLRDHGKLQYGDRVLINGASGGVGAFAVQIAKTYNCHVTAVASGRNEQFCLGLGADQFFNYHETDFTNADERWDLIFDAAGKSSYLKTREVLKSGGRYVSTEPSLRGVFMSLVTWPLSRSAKVMLARGETADLEELIRLYLEQKLTVTIDSRFPLSEAMHAHRRVEQGVDCGKVVVLLNESS